MPEEGSSFAAIVEAPPLDETQVSTPAEEVSSDATPTDGGQPEPETLGDLKEEEAPEGEDKPDLSTDPDLEKHPILKAKMEAFIAQKEKGIDKFITETNEKLKEANEFKEQYQPLAEFYQQFEDPETVDDAFARTCVALAKTHGRPFGGYDASGKQAGTTPDEPTEGVSKYGLEYDTDDKVVDVVLSRVDQLLEKRLGPISQEREQQAQAQQMATKAKDAVPALKSTFEVSADPWVTEEKVVSAMQEYPGLTPDRAFRAKYADDIAKYAVKHSSKPTVKNLPVGDMGGKTRSDLKVGASFGDIVSAEATL